MFDEHQMKFFFFKRLTEPVTFAVAVQCVWGEQPNDVRYTVWAMIFTQWGLD